MGLMDAYEVVHYSSDLPLNHLIGASTAPGKFASGKTFKISNH